MAAGVDQHVWRDRDVLADRDLAVEVDRDLVRNRHARADLELAVEARRGAAQPEVPHQEGGPVDVEAGPAVEPAADRAARDVRQQRAEEVCEPVAQMHAAPEQPAVVRQAREHVPLRLQGCLGRLGPPNRHLVVLFDSRCHGLPREPPPQEQPACLHRACASKRRHHTIVQVFRDRFSRFLRHCISSYTFCVLLQ